MMAWCRQLSLALRHVRASAKQNKTPFSNSYSTCMKHFSSPRQLPSFQRDFDINSKSVIGAFYKWLQQKGISTSTKMLAESETGLTPVSSPLIPVLSPSSGASASVKTKPSTVQAVLKGIRQSPKKVNLVAQLVRGMRVEDALLQLQVTVKRAAKTLYKVIKSARANASHNHGLDPERLVVAEAFVGKGLYLKRLSYHAKGRCGIMVRPHCRLTVVVREITAAEEAKIAMIKVMNYKKLTRKERQLVPHQLIETTPRWSRRPTETAHVEA